MPGTFSTAQSSFYFGRDGQLWSAGYNNFGQLGVGDRNDKFMWVATGLGNVKYVSAGRNSTYVVTTNGDLWESGITKFNADGTYNYSTKFVKTNMSNVLKVAAGTNHVLVLKKDGTVWGKGQNTSGCVGTGNESPVSEFAYLGNNIKDISCGSYHSFTIGNDNTIWSCGDNRYGQLGLNSTAAYFNTFQRVGNIGPTPKEVYCGAWHNVILTTDGRVYGCGLSGEGQLGVRNNAVRSFTQLSVTSVAKVVTGGFNTWLVTNNGRVWGAGQGTYGQLGNGTTNHNYAFAAYTGFTNPNGILAGDGHVLFFVGTHESDFKSAGLNDHGQCVLGEGTAVKVLNLTGMPNISAYVTRTSNFFVEPPVVVVDVTGFSEPMDGLGFLNDPGLHGIGLLSDVYMTDCIRASASTEKTLSLNGKAIYAASGLPHFIFSGNSNITINGGGGLITGGDHQVSSGVANGGSIEIMNSTLTLRQINFINNRCTGHGGAICTQNNSVLNIDTCNFINNSAAHGGAISTHTASTLNINSCEFRENTASSHGGAIQSNNTRVTITNATIKNNTAQVGGGIQGNGCTNYSMANVHILNNIAKYYCAGMYLMNGPSDFYTFTDVKLIGNTVDPQFPDNYGDCGGLYLNNTRVILTGASSELTNNACRWGGSQLKLVQGSTFHLKNQARVMCYNDLPQSRMMIAIENSSIVNADAGTHVFTICEEPMDMIDNIGEGSQFNAPKGVVKTIVAKLTKGNSTTFQTSIQEAINACSSTSDRIDVIRNVKLDEQIIVNKSCTIDLNNKTIDLQKTSRLMCIVDPNTTAIIQNGKFKNGKISNNNAGGIALLNKATATLKNLEISDCESSHHGAGIFVDEQSKIKIENCNIHDCVSNYTGAGISIHNSPEFSVIGTTIKNNRAADTAGGAYISNSVGKITNCTIENNDGGMKAGGIGFRDSRNCKVENCTIRNNTATTWGGGLWVHTYCNVTVDKNTIIEGNSLKGNNTDNGRAGAGVHAYESILTMDNCKIRKNYINEDGQPDHYGAGVQIWLAQANLTDCDIYENYIDGSNGFGAGIQVNHSGQITLNNVNIYQNRSTRGASITLHSTAVEDEPIVLYNSGNSYNNEGENDFYIMEKGHMIIDGAQITAHRSDDNPIVFYLNNPDAECEAILSLRSGNLISDLGKNIWDCIYCPREEYGLEVVNIENKVFQFNSKSLEKKFREVLLLV